MGFKRKFKLGVSATVHAALEHFESMQTRALEMRRQSQRKRYFRKYPSRCVDADVRQRENAFYQVAKEAVAQVRAGESYDEDSMVADTEYERRDARRNALAARNKAKRTFPLLIRAFQSDIVGWSASQVVVAGQSLLDSVKAYLESNSLSAHLHPTDALEELHAAMFDQDGWDGPDADSDFSTES